MTEVSNAPIPDGLLEDFMQILKDCGGTLTYGPIETNDRYGRWRVDYEYSNSYFHNLHNELWNARIKLLKQSKKPKTLWGWFKCLITSK